jgi:hypothetical protein
MPLLRKDNGMDAAWVFLGCCFALCAFQFALIAGAPWGHLTQGGRQHGALRPAAKGFAAVSIVLIVLMVLAILSANGTWPYWPRFTGWLALGPMLLTTVANWISPSRSERLLWGPVSLIMLGSAVVALIK